MKFEIDGNFELALQYLIRNSSEDALKVFDGLRGNDWYISTKRIKQDNEFLQYEQLKNKFEE